MPPSQNQTRAKTGRKGPPRPTTARGPHGGLLLSLVLHAGLIAGTYLTWHHMMATSDESHAVPVELITIARQTNVRAEAPPPDKIKVPRQEVEQPALPQFASLEPAPEPPIPQIKIKPDPSDSDKPDDNPKAAAKDFSALLNKLAAPATPPKNAKLSNRSVTGVGSQNLMTASLVDALRSQIARCWNVSAITGGPNAADSVVDFQVQLNRDGSVASLALASNSIARASINPYTRAASEAASRAIYECQPYHLPLDRYSEWSEINPFHFDPRQMMGQ